MKSDELKVPQAVDLGSGVTMVFCFIPAGKFRMGSRDGDDADVQPVHRVVIPQNFWLAATPVTQQQFAVFDPKHRNHFHDKPNYPAEGVD